MRPRRVGGAPPLAVAGVLARRILVLAVGPDAAFRAVGGSGLQVDHRGDRPEASFRPPVVRVAECAVIKGLGRVLEAITNGQACGRLGCPGSCVQAEEAGASEGLQVE